MEADSRNFIVVSGTEGEELTIWDSKESEFASGLEYRRLFGYVHLALNPRCYKLTICLCLYCSPTDQINDLDWTATPDNQSILAIGFAHRVEILSEQRMTYFDDVSAWDLCWKIDLEKQVSFLLQMICIY